jgi:hypothetical protein
MKTIYDIIEGMNSKRIITKRKSFVNRGFENLKNNELKYEFENCMKVRYNPRKHIKLKSLEFKTIYNLDALGKRRWNNYFKSGGRVYLISYSTKLPLCERILFDRKIRKFIGRDVPLPLKPKPNKREYVKGGKNGKILGFNFYFIEDKKMLPKHRRILLTKSEKYIVHITDEQTKNGSQYLQNDVIFLDPDLTDLEIAEHWNKFFIRYGYRFPEFEKQWFQLYATDEESDSLYLVPKEEDSETTNLSESAVKFDINKLFKTPSTNLG